MNILHKLTSNLPIIIVIDWLICALFFTHSEFYNNNFEVLDKIDTVITYFCLMHFFVYPNYYNNEKRLFILTIFIIITLNFFYLEIEPTGLYYFLYFASILMPFTYYTWTKSNMRKR